MHSIADLATTPALNLFKNEIPNVSDLAKKKKDYDSKIKNIEGKHFTARDYNTFTNDIIGVQIKHKDLVNKSDIFALIDSSDLDKKIESSAAKAELKAQQNKIVKL